MNLHYHQTLITPFEVGALHNLIARAEDGPDKGRATKRQVWEDMLQVMERLEMPISEKQRGFFK